MGKSSTRKSYTNTLLDIAKKDDLVMALTTDATGSVTLNEYVKQLPSQFIEMGIAEQNAISVAAGLALVGYKPFVSGPACFLSARAFDQIKVDIAYTNVNVKIVGVSGGVSYGTLGGTHLSLHDIAQMRAIPNLKIILPSDAKQTKELVNEMYEQKGPTYMRIGRSDVYDIYQDNVRFQIGKAYELKEGLDLTIIACGETVYYANQAAKRLEEEGISARVLDMHTIFPLDEKSIVKGAKETGLIITVEEHCIYGGLGSAVAEVVAQNCAVPMKVLGFPHKNLKVGSSDELFRYYGIDSEGIYREAKNMFLQHKGC